MHTTGIIKYAVEFLINSDFPPPCSSNVQGRPTSLKFEVTLKASAQEIAMDPWILVLILQKKFHANHSILSVKKKLSL